MNLDKQLSKACGIDTSYVSTHNNSSQLRRSEIWKQLALNSRLKLVQEAAREILALTTAAAAETYWSKPNFELVNAKVSSDERSAALLFTRKAKECNKRMWQ